MLSSRSALELLGQSPQATTLAAASPQVFPHAGARHKFPGSKHRTKSARIGGMFLQGQICSNSFQTRDARSPYVPLGRPSAALSIPTYTLRTPNSSRLSPIADSPPRPRSHPRSKSPSHSDQRQQLTQATSASPSSV